MSKHNRYVFFSSDTEIAGKLADSLEGMGTLVHEQPAPDVLSRHLDDSLVNMVFLDFVPDDANNEKLARSIDLARLLNRHKPDMPCVAVGRLHSPGAAVAALRAGVNDFIDLDNPEEVRDTVKRMARKFSNGREDETRYRNVLVLGVRTGMGSTLLSVHLASLLQELQNDERNTRLQSNGKADDSQQGADMVALQERTCLLDLGMPVADGMLYLNVNGNFDFVEGVRNLRRLDRTMLMSAMAHDTTGVTVMALPRDLDQLNNVSHADSLFLVESLRDHFGVMVIDVGGMPNPAFIAGLVRLADETWLVTDQSIAALVSLADILKDFKEDGISPNELSLVVNRYDIQYGMSAEQIAQRFGIPLKGTLPDRTPAIMKSTSQGHLLHQDAPKDPYIRALRDLANTLIVPATGKERPQEQKPGWLASFLGRDTRSGSAR
ncbi:pilus assembly protein CpaE [Advenella alkanexedens]|uniref:pilus assembly protein CpaE n=1 Tax=Advenella alkanexedens TaxID=1481665 RepID=UPI002676121B|nr:pilus assembly protein CpaE [Advenella alkanexedens]WKU19603.1 pilus assembly protein CpaE [Advenella alkanexedens]